MGEGGLSDLGVPSSFNVPWFLEVLLNCLITDVLFPVELKMVFNPGFKISMKEFSLENLSVPSARINFRGRCTAF